MAHATKKTWFVILGLSLCLAMLCSLGTAALPAAAEETAAPTVNYLGVRGDRDSVNYPLDLHYYLFFDGALTAGADLIAQTDVLGEQVLINGKTVADYNAELGGVYFNIHWMQDGGNEWSRVRGNVYGYLRVDAYLAGPLAGMSAADFVLELKEGIVAPSGAVLPAVENIRALTEDCAFYPADLTADENTAQFKEMIVTPGGESASPAYYESWLFFYNTANPLLTADSTEMQNSMPAIGNHIFINGYSVNYLNKLLFVDAGNELGSDFPIVKIHLMRQGTNDAIRLDILKDWAYHDAAGHPASPAAAGGVTIEILGGLALDTGTVLPSLLVSSSRMNGSLAMTENLNVTASALTATVLPSQLAEREGQTALAVESITPHFNDAMTVLSIEFNQDVNGTAATIGANWLRNNRYILPYILVNGQPLSDHTDQISGLNFPVDTASPDGTKLDIYFNTLTSPLKKDGTDVVEFLPGLRTPNGVELKTEIKFHVSTAYADEISPSLSGDYALTTETAGDQTVLYLSAADSLVTDNTVTAESLGSLTVNADQILLNGAALPGSASADYLFRNGKYVLAVRLASADLASR